MVEGIAEAPNIAVFSSMEDFFSKGFARLYQEQLFCRKEKLGVSVSENPEPSEFFSCRYTHSKTCPHGSWRLSQTSRKSPGKTALPWRHSVLYSAGADVGLARTAGGVD